MPQKDSEMLQHQFAGGIAPKKLNGFFHGQLLKTIPTTFFEHLGSVILSMWVPWKGKQFYHAKSSGDNVLPNITLPLAKWQLGDTGVISRNDHEYHALPFKTKTTKGLFDNIDVIYLDYDLPENPPIIRRIVDEIVLTETSELLGKAYLREKNVYRTVAFFRLYAM